MARVVALRTSGILAYLAELLVGGTGSGSGIGIVAVAVAVISHLDCIEFGVLGCKTYNVDWNHCIIIIVD
jgi:hypothetical protein